MDKQASPPSNLDLAHDRTGLAKFRTQLALDRTTLAWIRTTLTMATFGFGTVGFFRTVKERSPTPEAARVHHDAIQFGTALIVLGLLATVAAGISHWLVLRWPLSVALAMLLAVAGLLALWSLLQG